MNRCLGCVWVGWWWWHEPIVTRRWTYLSSIDAARRPAAVAVECGNSQNKYEHKGLDDIYTIIHDVYTRAKSGGGNPFRVFGGEEGKRYSRRMAVRNPACNYTANNIMYFCAAAQFLTHVRERSIDLCAFDFVCFRGGFRVPDQVIATTVTSTSKIRISYASSSGSSDRTVNRIGTGKTATAVGAATQSANRSLSTGRPVHR